MTCTGYFSEETLVQDQKNVVHFHLEKCHHRGEAALETVFLIGVDGHAFLAALVPSSVLSTFLFRSSPLTLEVLVVDLLIDGNFVQRS
jgi:hypothetical protein